MQRHAAIGRLMVLVLGACSAVASAALVPLDTANTQNGIFSIYSATFDGALSPCNGSSPSYCSFFHGDPPPPAARAITIIPNPTGVANVVPGGISPVPASGSSLNLTLSADHSQVTLAGGTMAVPILNIVISQGTPNETNILATGAGMVFNATPVTVAVDANGVAVFQVDLAPALAVDFSTLGTVVTTCSGPLCALVQVLTLDMNRYRMVLDYDATFGSFTASFIGQTANNSMVFANLISGVPKIAVTDSAPPGNDQQLPFGGVTVATSATRTVTVANTGTADLVLGSVAAADPLAAPFAKMNDTCSGLTLPPAANCSFDVVFSPGAVTPFSDTLDIPSNDATQSSVTVSVSGSGVPAPVPNIAVTDSVAPAGDLLVPFGNVTQGQQADQTVTVTNTGNANLSIGQVAAADPLAAPFSVVSDGCSNQALVPNATCTFGVRFLPAGAGSVSDTLDIPSDDPDQPSVTVGVSGTGVLPGVPDIQVTDDVAPANDLDVQFGNVTEATTVNHTVTVTNNGTAILLIGTIGAADPLASPFSIVTDNCSATSVAPTASCTIVVQFAPVAITAASDSFDIPSNDPDQPGVTVMVHGTGITAGGGNPVPVPSPTGANAGVFGSAADPATLLLLALLAGLRGRSAFRRDSTL